MLNLVKPISKKCLPMLALESHNCFCLLTYREKSKNTLTTAGNTLADGGNKDEKESRGRS